MANTRTYAQVSAATALGTTGVKTLIDTITLTAKAKQIMGVWAVAIGGATLTTGQPVSGVFELESPDLSLQPLQFPLDVVDVLTSGALAMNPHIIPVEIACQGQERILGYITLDLTNTGALKGRFGIITEG